MEATSPGHGEALGCELVLVLGLGAAASFPCSRKQAGFGTPAIWGSAGAGTQAVTSPALTVRAKTELRQEMSQEQVAAANLRHLDAARAQELHVGHGDRSFEKRAAPLLCTLCCSGMGKGLIAAGTWSREPPVGVPVQRYHGDRYLISRTA